MKHVKYGLLFLLFTLTEVFIGVFVHDKFIRPYFGDVLMVVVLYCLLRAVIPEKLWNRLHKKTLSLWVPLIFIFAAIVEILQGINIVGILGLENNSVMRTIIGTSFAWGDLICYLAGCIILWVAEWVAVIITVKRKPDQTKF